MQRVHQQICSTDSKVRREEAHPPYGAFSRRGLHLIKTQLSKLRVQQISAKIIGVPRIIQWMRVHVVGGRARPSLKLKLNVKLMYNF